MRARPHGDFRGRDDGRRGWERLCSVGSGARAGLVASSSKSCGKLRDGVAAIGRFAAGAFAGDVRPFVAGAACGLAAGDCVPDSIEGAWKLWPHLRHFTLRAANSSFN